MSPSPPPSPPTLRAPATSSSSSSASTTAEFSTFSPQFPSSLGGSPPVSTPPHLPHLSGSSATFASLSRHYGPHHYRHQDPDQTAAAAATSSRLGGLGSGMSIGAGGGTVASGTAPQGQTIESLKEAVMRSQNKARERSRLNHATLPSSSPSPPLLPLPLQHLDEPEYPSPPPDTSPPPRSAPATAEVRPSTSKQSSSSTLTGFPQLFNRPAAPMMSQAYPFPPMRTMSTNSIGASFNSPGTGPLDRLIPSGGAPTPASVAFYPPGSKPVEVFENSDFPTPNMYELALLLHSEPGMEAFWNNLIHIATTCYKAERVTLALPSDSTDLENTPWGQKATFNIAEDGLSAGDGRVDEADAGAYYVDSDGYQGVAIPTAEEPPPNVYVDQDSGKLDLRGDLDQQDSDPVPIDTCVDGPFGTVTIGLQDTPFDSTSNSDWISVTSGASPGELETLAGSSDIDYEQDNMNKAFGSKEGVVRGKVFPTLVPLNCEADALLDETGVSRVLQRGKTVVLSREYRDVKTHFEQREKRRKDGHLAKPPPEKGTTDEKKAGRSAGLGKLDMPNTSFRAPSQPSTPLYFAGKGWRRKKTQPPNDEYTHNPVLQYYSAQQEQPLNNRPTAYEEYEQAITSPWSQSPAPSPAPRQDPSENPFFTAFPKVDEDTFNPAATSPVYSAQEPVNAIGYESSWTVIHIPLVHPCQSNSLGSSRIGTESVFGGVDDGLKQKRAPIAILSMLSPAIPYPSNLIHSLSHFAPLAATAFSLASTHSSVLNQLDQLTSMRKKRPSQRPSMIPRQMSFMSENTSQNTSPGACLGSVTSPSDTSSTVTVSNLNSPCESSGGGLRWARSDSGDLRSTSSPPRAPGSPLAGNQSDESYFGQPIFSRQTGSVVPPPLPKGSDPESYTSLETRMRMRGDEEIIPSQKGKENGYFPDQTAPQTGSSSSAETDDTTPTQVLQDRSASDEGRKLRKSLRKRPGTGSYHHSYLHSYGASTFQSLAASSSPVTAKAGVPGNKRPTNVNVYAMPPPSNRLLRIIIDSIPVHVFTSAPDTGRITWANNRMLTYRGTTAKEFMRNPWDALHPDDKDEYLRRWGIAIRKGESFSHEMRVRRFDGVYRKFMVRAVPLRDPRGVIVHWFGTNMDVEDQKKAEENAARQAKTAESEHKYRSLANSSPQIVFAATANAGITFANTQWLQYSGQTLEQAEKLGFMEHVHPADRNKCCLPGDGGGFVGVSFSSGSEGAADIAGGIEKDHEDRPTFSTQLRLKDKYGNYRWHLVRCVSVKSNADDGGLWFGTCTDINDQKLVEQTLKDANEAAQKAMESKTRFLANMSHEIRTPLIGISGMVTFLLDTPLNGEQLDYCHTISQSSEGLLSVINDILDLSKVEAGMMRLNPEWFRISSLVEDAHELLCTMAINKGLELNFIVETDVPPVMYGDRVRLRQVLLNIIGNAIKFTSLGEVFSRYSVVKDAGVKDDEVMIQIECFDTGPGFDAKDEEYMFKPFSQIDGSSTRAHGGSGLGLVISRQLVELHGGRLTAKSEKGKGSTFTASAKFKIPKTKETGPTPDDGEGYTATEHILDSGVFVESPPGLSYTEGSSTSTASPASTTGVSIRSQPSYHSENATVKHYTIPSPQDPGSMRLTLPIDAQQKYRDAQDASSRAVDKRESFESDARKVESPAMFSILIVADQPYSRRAISHHIKVTLPDNIPSKITNLATCGECLDLVAGDHPLLFTHVVLSLPEYSEIITLLSHLLKPVHSNTTVLVLTSPTQRQAILSDPSDVCKKLGKRLQFIYKPIKPSRFGDVFDPTKERDASMNRHRDSAQRIVEKQKKVFTRLEHEVGNKGYKVLLVEDNRVNQKVLLKFLAKVGLEVETASDGEECVEKVFSKDPGHYGLILCDLHMPRKDGFQATTEIRQWEKEHGSIHVPIVALSANVMSDVADKCAVAGFSRYVTKPVNFRELSMTIKELLPSTGDTPPGSPEPGDREIERLKEKDRREISEQRRREIAEADEAAKRRRRGGGAGADSSITTDEERAAGYRSLTPRKYQDWGGWGESSSGGGGRM